MKNLASLVVPRRISRRRILTGGAAFFALPFASAAVGGASSTLSRSQLDVGLDIRKAKPAPLVRQGRLWTFRKPISCRAWKDSIPRCREVYEFDMRSRELFIFQI